MMSKIEPIELCETQDEMATATATAVRADPEDMILEIPPSLRWDEDALRK
jgi:hypothetical protein